MKTSLVLLAVSGSLAVASQRHLAEIRLPQTDNPLEALPSESALTFMSLGYKSVAADYYWLRAISHFGDIAHHRGNYPNLEPLVRRVLHLDPHFCAAYRFAGTALTLPGMDLAQAQALLHPGIERCPEDWKIPFYYGFNAYYFLHDFPTAAAVLAVAAQRPGAPALAGPLATRLAAQAGNPRLGLQLIDSMLPNLTDEQLLETYRERRNLLLLELQLQELNLVAERFRSTHQRHASSLEELHRVGLLAEIPTEPLGGEYRVHSKTGLVYTTNEKRRLRLSKWAVHR